MTATVSCLIANLAKPQTEAVSGVGLRQYRAARWLLLPEAELRPRRVGAADCKSGRTLMQICEDRNSPAPRNSSASRSKAYSPRRCDHFPYTSPPGSHSGHLQGTSGAQVNCTKVRRVRYSLPADKKHLTQRAACCVNGWSVRESGLLDFGWPARLTSTL